MFFFFLFNLFSVCLADVAFVTFSGGDLEGSIRFEQDEGSSEVTITSNILDISNSHGASISWATYSDYVDIDEGETCADKGTQVLDLTTLLESELRIGYTSYTTDNFAFSDLYSTSLVLGLDVACSGIAEIPEALRVYSTIRWNEAVGNDIIEQSRVATATTFQVDLSRVLAVPYYPISVDTTINDLPEGTTDETIVDIYSESLRQILDLQPQDDVDVYVTPSASPTEKDVTFVVTSYTNGTYVFLYDHISSSPTFLPQLQGSVQAYGAFRTNKIWLSSIVINSVQLRTTIALSTADVSGETYTELDVQDLIPEYEANLAAMNPPGTLLEFVIHSETKSPSVSPSRQPSTDPTKAPSVMPTVMPSTAPSTQPSRAPICGPEEDVYLGDPFIQLSDSQSQYASGNFEMTVVFPFKFTAYQLRFKGDTSETYKYDQGDPEDPWVSSDQKCLKQMTVTIPWQSIQDGSVGITWNSATNSFEGVFDLHLKQTVTREGSQTLGSTFERDIEYEMPFAILMHTAIVVEADLTITMSDPTLTSKALNGINVVVPDGANPSVTVLFCTEIPYPWILEVPSPASDMTLVGTDVVANTGTLQEISRRDCDTFGSDCSQCWQSSWEVTEVCKDTGDYTITIPAQYLQVPPYTEEVNLDVTMRLSLMPACEVMVATVDPAGSLVMYSDATYSSSSIVFYIDSEAWGRITVDALQDIESLSLDRLLVKQDGVSQSLQTTAFEFEEIARTTGDVATIDWKCRFTLSELKGEITGKETVITADLTIAYVDGSRRRLQVTIGENDVPSETTAESTIVLLQGPCSLPFGRLDEVKTTPCAGSSDKRLMRCLSTGWEILVECPTQTIQQDILVTETDEGLPWKLLTVVLGVTIGLSVAIYWSITSYCTTRKGDKFSFSPASQAVDTI